MRVSWSWLSEMVDLGEIKTPERLAEILTQRGLEVESIEKLGSGFEKVITAQIVKKDPHPAADRLSLCLLETGLGGPPLEIVCGAKNMKSGDKVALAQVGACLPNGVQITQSKIRGVVSNGMLCSEEELKLKGTSEGILILPPDTVLGLPLAKVLNREDVVFTLKVTPNRADCLSHYGIARELAAAQHQKLSFPLVPPLSEQCSETSPIEVKLSAGQYIPQFFGCLIEGVRVGPSPQWLSSRLETLGFRSVNNIVDATNWLMLELGQPVHAYDADQIQAQKIELRFSQAAEQLPLLDGKTIELGGKELVVADAKRPIALAGIMGGGNSEIQGHTQRIFLECAEFDPKLVRQASARYQRRTEGSYRFERGIDPENLSFALSRLVQIVLQVAGGKIAGLNRAQLPSRTNRLAPTGAPALSISLLKTEVQEFLGFEKDSLLLTSGKIEQILKDLACQVQSSGAAWLVTPPSYRLDLKIKEDLIEEVARSIGYDKIPSRIPPLSGSPTFQGSSRMEWNWMMKAKQALVQQGFLEALNFAFTSRNHLAAYGFESDVSLSNPLSEEHEMLVPSLLPGLLKNAEENWNHHFGSEPLAIRLFELRPTFKKSPNIQPDSAVTGIQENWKLSFLMTGPRYQNALRSELGELDFYDLKASVELLLGNLAVRGLRIRNVLEPAQAVLKLFHPGQSAEVLLGNEVAGCFGMLHPQFLKKMKARSPIGLAEFDWASLKLFARKPNEFPKMKLWPSYPSIERDFALLVKEDVPCERICQIATRAGKPLARQAQVFDIYRGKQLSQGMTSVAVRVIFYNETRSLLEAEAESASHAILAAWKKELGAELRNETN